MVSTVCSMPLFLVRSYTVSYSFSSLIEPWGAKGWDFPFSEGKRSISSLALAMQLLWPCNSLVTLSKSPFVPPPMWFQQPAGPLPTCHTLLVSSQRTKDCGWSGCRNVHLWHGNSSWRTLEKQVHPIGAAQATSWAKQFLLLHLALWPILGSTQALDLWVCLILHGEQRPFLQALHYPTQELMLLARLGTPSWLNGWAFCTTKHG